MPVVAAAMENAEGRWLLQQRPPGKAHGGLWEFPGGKVESGENPRFALAREISEELGITLDPQRMDPAGFAEGEGGKPPSPIVLFLYTCPFPGGAVTPTEGQAWGWFNAAEARKLDLAPMDRQLLDFLTR